MKYFQKNPEFCFLKPVFFMLYFKSIEFFFAMLRRTDHKILWSVQFMKASIFYFG